MASIIEGYSYDIFISYRQKDNKGDRWVSEFVESPKTELESTLKEDVSIYFDENPHDGLLETQDVDATLKEKLKCLIFIPVISRTYCDPRSFAWEHEFKAFINQESEGNPGLKVSLPNGNVASRILPVKIHELDISDTILIESALGGVLRGVDFIYKAPGVNRPLRLNEEHPRDNVNKTYYRDQINKVANSIDSIISGMQSELFPMTKENIAQRKNVRIPGMEYGNFLSRYLKFPVPKVRRSFWTWLAIIAMMLFMGYRFLYTPMQKSVALIPFTIENNDPVLTLKGNELMNAVYTKLKESGGIKMGSLINSLKYKDADLPASQVGKALKVNYLIVGSINQYSDDPEVFIELVKAKNNRSLFYKNYSAINNVLNTVAETIAGDIITEFTKSVSEEEEEGANNSAKGVFTHLNFMSANTMTDEATFDYLYGNKLMDSTSYLLAIKQYDKAIRSDSLFALAYVMRSIAISLGIHAKQLNPSYLKESLDNINQAVRIDDKLPEIQDALGFYYYYCEPDYKRALEHFRNASARAPGNYKPLFYMAAVYRNMGEWTKSQELMRKVIDLNPREALIITNIGLSYQYLHDYDSALIYHQKAIEAMPEWRSSYINKLEAFILLTGNTLDAWAVLREAESSTGKSMDEYKALLSVYDRRYSEALGILRRSKDSEFEITGGRYLMMADIYRYMGRNSQAAQYYDSAIIVLDKKHLEDPDNFEIQGLMGLAFAGRGDRTRAIEYGENSVRLAGETRLSLPDMKVNLARIYTTTGEYMAAASLLDELLNSPSAISFKLIQIDPYWNPLKKNPAYEVLSRKYSEK